jgi:hypothetical protein
LLFKQFHTQGIRTTQTLWPSTRNALAIINLGWLRFTRTNQDDVRQVAVVGPECIHRVQTASMLEPPIWAKGLTSHMPW